MKTQRIAVVGVSASGKSIFSRRLAEKTGFPLIHMDQLFWQGNWEEVPEEQYLKKHKEAVGGGAWIIEGYIDEKMADRLKRAQQIIYLDYAGIVCALRLILRWIKHRKKGRPELSLEAVEKPTWDFFWRVLTRKERTEIEEAVRIAGNSALVRLHTPKQTEKFIENFR